MVATDLGWINPNLVFTESDGCKYREEGYGFLGQVLTKVGLKRVRSELSRILCNLHPTVMADQIFSVHQSESWLMTLVSQPRLLDVVEEVIGPDIVVWATNFICKPPKTGRPIPWHQDLSYWSISGSLASIWIALDNVDDENGTMYVLPCYQKKGTLPQRAISTEFFTDELVPNELPNDVGQREIGYFLKAGEAAIHHELIPHRSPANRSPRRWRRVLVIRYMSAEGQMPPLQYRNYKTGEMFDRRFFLLRGKDVGQHGLVRV